MKQGDGWIAREKESGKERKPLFKKKRQIHKRRPSPNKKPPPLTLPTLSGKERKKREQRRGILVGQVALRETMPIMLFFDL